jgi:molybdate transport system ATP-binding protein
MLKVDIQNSFDGFQLDACFTADTGVLALFGRSGAGKSTILSAIAGLIKPDQGRIDLDGKCLFDRKQNIDVPAHQRGLAMVFQNDHLFPHMDVKSNLLYGRWAGGRTSKIDFDKVVQILGLDPLLDRKPGKLSGGEKQRVSIGRAVLSDPKLLLLDEPLASLDVERRRRLLSFFRTIRSEFKIPMIFVSHDPDDVIELSDHMVLIDQGQIIQHGSVPEVFASQMMQSILGEQGQGVVIDGQIEGFDASYQLANVRLKSDGPDGSHLLLHVNEADIGRPLRMFIRARDVAIALTRPVGMSLQNCLPVSIVHIEQVSMAHMNIICDCDGQVLRAQITRKSCDELGLELGAKVFALIKSVALT